MQEGRHFNNKGPHKQEEISSRVEGLMADGCFFSFPLQIPFHRFIAELGFCIRRALPVKPKSYSNQRLPQKSASVDAFYLAEEELNNSVGLFVC